MNRAHWIVLAALALRAATPAVAGKQDVIEGAVISPYQNANVGAEVSGIVENFRFQEGDLVRKGDVVAEISPKRYATTARRAIAARSGSTTARRCRG